MSSIVLQKSGLFSNCKVNNVLILGILFLVLSAYADGNKKYAVGFNVMVGGRYDNLRMCVATPAGKKGGPIADIMVNTRFYLNDQTAIGFKLPVMRPILFGIAFKMLQFEPEFIFEYTTTEGDKTNFVLGSGLGASFHYGPDYTTEKEQTNREDFFAAGPFVSGFMGLNFNNQQDKNRLVGIRAFYVPLFTKERTTGTVLGGALEGHFDLFTR